MHVQPISDIAVRSSPDGPSRGAEGPQARTAPASPPGPAERLSDPKARSSGEGIFQAVDGVNAFLQSQGRSIHFTVHDKTDRIMVEVMDDRTDEVITTIPAEELLDLAAKIGELVGTLLDRRA
ncbi:MAG: hypothetical protein Kow0092_05040 [Deferrisomatales bacterium]